MDFKKPILIHESDARGEGNLGVRFRERERERGREPIEPDLSHWSWNSNFSTLNSNHLKYYLSSVVFMKNKFN